MIDLDTLTEEIMNDTFEWPKRRTIILSLIDHCKLFKNSGYVTLDRRLIETAIETFKDLAPDLQCLVCERIERENEGGAHTAMPCGACMERARMAGESEGIRKKLEDVLGKP